MESDLKRGAPNSRENSKSAPGFGKQVTFQQHTHARIVIQRTGLVNYLSKLRRLLSIKLHYTGNSTQPTSRGWNGLEPEHDNDIQYPLSIFDFRPWRINIHTNTNAETVNAGF